MPRPAPAQTLDHARPAVHRLAAKLPPGRHPQAALWAWWTAAVAKLPAEKRAPLARLGRTKFYALVGEVLVRRPGAARAAYFEVPPTD